VSGDSNWSSVSLLLHCDGADGSTTFTDSSSYARTITAVGTANISTTTPRWGTGAALIDVSGERLTAATAAELHLSTGDFTIELWFRREVSGAGMLINYSVSAGSTYAWTLFNNSGNGLTFWAANDAGADIVTLTGGSTSINTWHHVAVTRAGSSWRMFLDGTQVGSTVTSSASIRPSASGYILAMGAYPNGGTRITGRLDDIRITAGVARYTASFTAPTAAFPDGPPPAEIRVQGRSGLGTASLLARQQSAQVQGRSGLGTAAVLMSDPAQARIQGRSGLGTASVRLWRLDAYAQGTSALGRASVQARQQAAQVLGRSALGRGAVAAVVPQSARVLGRSPLGSARVTAWHDFTGAVSETSVLAYVMDLIGPGGVSRVPISSWQATLQTDASCYVQCVVPACQVWLDTIVAATEFVIYRRATLTNGAAIEYEMARSPLEVRNYAQGPNNYTATLSGYPQALTPNASPPAAYDRTLAGVRSVSDGNGGMRVRADVDWLLRPGMRAFYGATPILVDYINYYVPGNDQYMDVGERA
jgi:hypothetical protein